MTIKANLALASLLTCGVLALSPASALAKEIHVLTGSFGSEGSGVGQLKEPQGVAVNDATNFVEAGAGDVYVVDKGNDRVERFSSAGAYLGQFNGSGSFEVEGKKEAGAVAPTGVFSSPEWVAVDNDPMSPSHGDVYVTDNGHDVIDKFSETGEYLSQITKAFCPPPKGASPIAEIAQREAEEQEKVCPRGTEVSLGELEGIAVDSVGDVWIDQLSSGLRREATEIDSYGDGPENKFLTSAWVGQVSARPGFAVGAEEDLYINQPYENNAIFGLFTDTGEALTFSPVLGGPPSSGVSVNLSTDDVFVDHVSSVKVFQVSNGEVLGEDESFGSGQLSAGTGVAVNFSTANPLSNSVYVADGDHVDIFGYVDVPSVTTEPASGVEVKREAGHAAVGATLNATVDPNGLPVSSCEFEYGTSASYGHGVSCEQSLATISEGTNGKGEGPVSVTAKISNLLPAGTYHFRLRAANKNDEDDPSVVSASAGADETFQTPGPSVSEAAATEVTASTATLSGEVSPGGVPLNECKFEYATSSEYDELQSYGHSAPCESPSATEIGEGTAPVKAHADVQGLQGGTTYRFRLIVATEVFTTGETATVAGAGRELRTSPVPVISGAEARDLTAGSAELAASVNPEGVQVNRCVFEYGPTTEYGQVAKCEQRLTAIGAGSEPVPVSASIDELQPNTTYHWRLAVKDRNGEGAGVDHTFVYPTTATELPDHRAYELVTPPFKNGALVTDTFGPYPYHIAESGSRLIARSIQCFAGSESCEPTRGEFGDPFEFSREAGGWATTPLTPSASQFSENTAWLESADAGTALFSMPTGPAQEDEWYKREANGAFVAIGPATPPGATGNESFHLGAHEASADFSHLVWETGSPFWSFDNTGAGASDSAYEYVGVGNEKPFLVGVTGPAGSAEQISRCGTSIGGPSGNGGSRWNAVSADGHIVYFTAQGHDAGAACPSNFPAPPVRELFARVDGEGVGAHTVAISEPQTLEPGARAECDSAQCVADTGVANQQADWRDAEFIGASADGSKALFLDTQQLTDGATEGTGNAAEGCSASRDCNLYQYDLDASPGARLIDVSAPATGGETPRVQGVVAHSADGSHVYFVAQGVLTGAPNGQGQSAVSGRDNLYVSTEGHTTFIASLPAADSSIWEGTGGGEAGYMANVTPDGRFLVFESHGDLTLDDTRTDGARQVFRYEAATAELARISIGEEGYADDGNAGTGEASIVPALAGEADAGAARGDPTMSDDGAYVFFQSPIGLTPRAFNDVLINHTQRINEYSGAVEESSAYAENVYEWHEGRVYLISDGHDVSTAGTACVSRVGTATERFTSAVCLLGADTTGANVFFMTADQLVPRDTDTQVDIYDARICEPEVGNPCITEPSPALAPCGGEACHGIPGATPSLLTPGTASFDGEGNKAPESSPAVVKKTTKKAMKCKKDFIKKKNRCVRIKDKKKAKRSTRDRRAVS